MKNYVCIRKTVVTVLLTAILMSCTEVLESIQKLNYHTHAFGVFQMTDGGLLIAAVKANVEAKCKNYCDPTSASTFRDICLIRTDSSGNPLWEKVFPEPGDEGDFSAAMTSDGYLLVAGNRGEDDFFDNGFTKNGFVAKFTLDGNLVWRKTVEAGRTKLFSTFSVSQEGDAAKSISNKSTHGFVVLDKNGDKNRDSVFSSTIPNFTEVVFLRNNDLLTLKVKDKNTTGGEDRLIERFDQKGELLWSRTIAMPVMNLAKATDNGFWALDKKGWLGRFDADGELTWSKSLIFMNNRVVYFDSNESGKLVVEVLEGMYGPNQLRYFLINDREVEKVFSYRYSEGSLKPTFIQVLANQTAVLVESEEKYVSKNNSQEGYYDCRLQLSKLNTDGKRVWTNTIGRGKKSGILPLLVDI
ncbi:MAG: hypothetical protein U0X91_05630 [Spirosomataceae bacterium]